MILTLDAGNSRIKWAWWQNDAIVEQGAAAYDKASPAVALQPLLAGQRKPETIYALCVAGELVAQQLSDWAQQQWQLPLLLLRTAKHFAHIRHAYPEPAQHGADRWAAVVEAHFLYPQHNLCVIGAGTAITFDFIDAGGKHLGGYILPSAQSMLRALTADTANVVSTGSSLELPSRPSGLPDNTADAVTLGIRLLLQAGIRDLCQQGLSQMRQDSAQQAREKIIITGGYAPSLLNYSEMPAMKHHPELVMQGLYRIMRADGAADGAQG